MPAAARRSATRLGRLGRHRDDADADRLLRDDRGRARRCADDQVADAAPTLCGSLSKIADTTKPCLPQTVVVRDRRAEVARTDEREPVHVVGAEDALDPVDQRADVVADAALAERAEVREVAPDLRGVDVRELAEPRRGDRRLPVLAQLDEHVEVQRQALDDAFRNACALLVRPRVLPDLPGLGSNIVTTVTKSDKQPSGPA